MNSAGEYIRTLRIVKNISLATAAMELNMKEYELAEIENGSRVASSLEAEIIENYCKTFINSVDKITTETDEGIENLRFREDEVAYAKIGITKSNEDLIADIKSFLKVDNRISAAYLFGSYARGDEKPDSDLDLMVEFKTDKKYSLFDLQDIAFFLQKKINVKVDIVEKGFIHEFAMLSVTNDLIKIYG